MSEIRQRGTGNRVWLLLAALGAVGILATAALAALYGDVADVSAGLLVGWPIVGAALVLYRPGNNIGKLMVLFSFLFGIWISSETLVLVSRQGVPVPALDLLTWLAIGVAPPTLSVVIFIIALFPSGELRSSWLRWPLRIVFGLTVLGVLIRGVLPITTVSGDLTLTNPWGIESLAPLVPLDGVAFGLAALVLLASAVDLVVRWRRSEGVERLQMRALAMGITFWVLMVAGTLLLNLLGLDGSQLVVAENLAWTTGLAALPVAIGAAVARYRLYDIDIVVSKSVTYLGLAASITLLYTAVAVGPLLVIGVPDDGEGPGLVLPIVATGAVALLFEPIRTRLQRWANRMVYGDRATPQEVLSRVTARLSDTAGGNGTQDLARLLAGGTGAERVVVWSRFHDGLRPEAIHQLDRSDAVGTVPVDGLVDDELTESRSVLHQGVLFGALSITKARNDPITPDDRELLSDVAAGAGLLLRNISLNRELEERAEELRASRRRLIAAQDAERHRLERDLHDGAQQQVVALKVKLGIAKTIAEREGADEIAVRVSALAEETQQAVDALRAVAHGIYPPLLEAEGLQSALRAVERTSSIPLVLDVAGITRYGRSIEETVYFSVLETVERARMSGAREVEARLAAVNGELLIEVGLDGVTEIDLTAVSDRIDASGGMLRIDQTDGGTALTARFQVLDSTAMVSSPSAVVPVPS